MIRHGRRPLLRPRSGRVPLSIMDLLAAVTLGASGLPGQGRDTVELRKELEGLRQLVCRTCI